MESGTFASIGIIGFQRCCGLRILDNLIHPRSDLLHDSEITFELLFNELLHGQFAVERLSLFKILRFPREIIIVRLHGRAAS